MRTYFFLTFLVSASFLSIGKSTKVYPDAGSWSTINLDFVLNKKWTAVFTQEIRIKENYGRLNLFYTNLGFEYRVNKNVKTSLVYRWIDKFKDDNTFSFRHRLMWDIVAKTSIKQKWDISYRHRLQVEYSDFQTSYYGHVPEWYSRHKLGVDYSINKKWSTNFSTEMRYQLYDRTVIETQHTWHRVRFQCGGECKLTESDKIGAYYLIQKEFNVVQPQNIYITGIEYSHKFKL